MYPINSQIVFEKEGCVSEDCCAVIVASYNYAHYVLDTLDSVVAQSFPPIELVVVDDASTDNSTEKIASWMINHADRFVRCILVRHISNQGLAQTRNTAFQTATSRFVFVLDSDNLLYSRCLDRHFEVMDRTGAAAVYAIADLFDHAKGIGPADVFDRTRLSKGNYIDAMALVSKSAWEGVGGYAHFNTMGWEDYDLWLKFIEAGLEILFIPEILCRYRVHPKSMNNVETGPKAEHLTIEFTMRHPSVDFT